ncbi:hypothetical protein [Streptomyces zaomyceticus]|uniref:hypothetical protein n=1 Tax=Streptomyces zaomyceticus TaxID=68286 RepID=UPI00369AE475
MLTGYQTPAAVRGIGRAGLATWLKNHGVRTGSRSKITAAAAVTAVETQFTAVRGGKAYAKMVQTLAREEMSLGQEIAELEALIEGRFRVALIRGGRSFEAITRKAAATTL